MKKTAKNSTKFLSALLVLAPLSVQAGDHYFYRVKKDDVLTKILHGFGFRPVYGKSGSYVSTLKKNPKQAKTKGNLIRPGEVIILPQVSEAHLTQWARIEATGEVHPLGHTPKFHRQPAAVAGLEPQAEASAAAEEAAAAPVMPQAQAPQSTASAEDPQSLDVELSYGSGSAKLTGKDEATGATAKLQTKSNTGLGIALTQNLTSNFFLSGTYQRNALEFEDSNVNSVLESKKFTLSRLSLGAGMRSKNGSTVTISGVSGNLPYFYSPTPGTVKIVSNQYAGAGLDGKLTLLTKGKFRLQGLAGATMIFPSSQSNFTADNGYSYQAGLSSQYTKGSFGVSLNPYFEQYKYDSSISTHGLSDLGFRIKLHWNWE